MPPERPTKLSEPIVSTSCVPAPMRAAFTQIRDRLNSVVSPIINSFFTNNSATNIANGGPTYVFNIDNNVTGQLPTLSSPAFRIQLTSAVSGGAANAKLYRWNGGSYAAGGSAFEVFDTFDRWSHAKSGDRGYAIYDPDREAFTINWLNTLSIRRFDFTTGSLGSGGSITIDGYEIWGDNVDTSKVLNGSSGNALTAYYDHSDHRWIAFNTVKCAAGA